MTHDSIGLGEDGPTHQPIEQLSGLRSIPNLNIFRPADRLETIECWEHALKSSKTPSVLSLTRQNLNPFRNKYSKTNMCSSGEYEVLRTNKKVKLTILASGSEVNLAIETSHKLAKDRILGVLELLKACSQHSIVSNLSAGLKTLRLGIDLNPDSCSMG